MGEHPYVATGTRGMSRGRGDGRSRCDETSETSERDPGSASPQCFARTSWAARWPERTAPSM
jgi:hypothetical protein